MKKWVAVGTAVAALIGLLVWLFIESSKPLPGTKIADLGRGHVEIGTVIDYNSNPPTSGKHYEEWIKAGVLDSQKDDRNLVHSLEHGYVIMHYKCTLPVIASEAKQSNQEIASPSSMGPPSAPRNDDKKECNVRKDQLAKIYEKKGRHKLIAVPRSNLDTNFALTAWDWLDKFNDFDEARIEKFIDVHIEQGPEKTMEP